MKCNVCDAGATRGIIDIEHWSVPDVARCTALVHDRSAMCMATASWYTHMGACMGASRVAHMAPAPPTGKTTGGCVIWRQATSIAVPACHIAVLTVRNTTMSALPLHTTLLIWAATVLLAFVFCVLGLCCWHADRTRQMRQRPRQHPTDATATFVYNAVPTVSTPVPTSPLVSVSPRSPRSPSPAQQLQFIVVDA